MKKVFAINLDKHVHKQGVEQAKAFSKKREEYISFSKYVQMLILKDAVNF